jgi:hypothetical protein
MADAVSADPRYVAKTMLAAGLGIALFCGGFWIAGAVPIKDWNPMSNFLATPLFALPLIVALFRSGRIGWVGTLVVTGGMTAAHLDATAATIANYDMGPLEVCFFGDVAKCEADYAREKAAHDPIGKASAHNAGAIGGALGAAFSFAFIATLAPGLRDGRRLSLYAVATLALAALGWVGFGGTLPEDSERANLEWAFKLYLPWQLAFSFAIAMAFKDHQAERFTRS